MNFKLDRNEIISNCEFLILKEYELTDERENSITFSDNQRKFVITYDKLDNVSSISYSMRNSKKIFSIGWFAFIRESIKTNMDNPLQNTLNLLQFINANYDQLLSLDYCIETERRVDDYLRDLRR